MAIPLRPMQACFRARRPFVLVSDPGMGKTTVMATFAEEQGYAFENIIASDINPDDVKGIPAKMSLTRNGETEAFAEFLKMPWFRRVFENPKTILHFDELGNAHRDVQVSLLAIFNERHVCDTFLPDETFVCGSMNPYETSVNPIELGIATANRLTFLPFHVSYDEWAPGMLTNWGRLDPERDASELEWRKIIVNFLEEHRGLFYVLPDSVNPISMNKRGTPESYQISSNDFSRRMILDSAWPSNRSWDSLAKVLAHIESGDKDSIEVLAQGTVGYQAAIEFSRYLENVAQINIDAALVDPQSLNWKKFGADSYWAMSQTISARINDNSVDIGKVVSLYAYLIEEVEVTSYIASSLRSVLKAATIFSNKVSDKDALSVVRKAVLVETAKEAEGAAAAAASNRLAA